MFLLTYHILNVSDDPFLHNNHFLAFSPFDFLPFQKPYPTVDCLPRLGLRLGIRIWARCAMLIGSFFSKFSVWVFSTNKYGGCQVPVSFSVHTQRMALCVMEPSKWILMRQVGVVCRRRQCLHAAQMPTAQQAPRLLLATVFVSLSLSICLQNDCNIALLCVCSFTLRVYPKKFRDSSFFLIHLFTA